MAQHKWPAKPSVTLVLAKCVRKKQQKEDVPHGEHEASSDATEGEEYKIKGVEVYDTQGRCLLQE